MLAALSVLIVIIVLCRWWLSIYMGAVLLLIRFWETLCHSAKGDCSFLQGTWCNPASTIWNWKNCYVLLWSFAAAWLQLSWVPGTSSCSYSWTCTTNWEGHASTRGLSRCQGSCLCWWDQCSWRSTHPFKWGSCSCWYSWTCIWYVAQTIFAPWLHQDVCIGWGRWDALSRF